MHAVPRKLRIQYLVYLLFFFFLAPHIKIMQGNGAEVNRMKETYYHKNMLISWLFHVELVKASKYLHQASNSRP